MSPSTQDILEIRTPFASLRTSQASHMRLSLNYSQYLNSDGMWRIAISEPRASS